MKITKKQKKWILWIGIIIIGIILLGLISGKLKFFALSNEQYIQVPVFMYYECSPATGLTNSPLVDLPEGGSWYECPANSDGCDFYGIGESNVFFGRRFKFQICEKVTNVCYDEQIIDVSTGWWFWGNTNKPYRKLSTLTKTQKINIKYQSQIIIWQNAPGSQIFAQYKPFIIWKVSILGGGKTEYTTIEKGCKFSYGDRDNAIVSSTIDIGHKDDASGYSSYILEPYKTLNVIESFIPISIENYKVVSWNGQQAYCINNKIYKIDTVITEDGTNYKIVDINKNAILSSVNCCPGDVEPGYKCQNYQWIPIEEAECSSFKPCEGIEFRPSGSKKLVRYSCINGKCVPEFKNVECTSDVDCIGNPNGNICDTLLWKCVKVAPPPGTNYTLPLCESCDGFALSTLIGSIWKEKQCNPKWNHTYTLCIFSFIKYLLIPIILIFTILFSVDFLERFKTLKGEKNKIWRFLISIILGIILGYMVYVAFWIGIIIFIGYTIIRTFLKI